MEIFANELGVEAAKAELARIYRLTGGVGKWVKWFLVHPEESEDFKLVLEPTARLIGECSDEQLKKLGLWENGGWKGEILAKYFQENQRRKRWEIEITADLSVVEKGQASGVRLTKLEAEILGQMAKNEGVVTKEGVSDLKWGEGKYDKFSDQAINKGMRRLDKKLKVYTVKTIPGYGFKLAEREK